MPSEITDALATVQGFYDAMGRGDVPSALGCMSPGIIWNEAEGHPLAHGNPYVGPGAVAQGVFAHLVGAFDGFSVQVDEILPAGSKVVMLGRYIGAAKSDGAKLDAQTVHVWTVTDGKLSQFQQYTDTLQWTQLLAVR